MSAKIGGRIAGVTVDRTVKKLTNNNSSTVELKEPEEKDQE